MAVLRVTQGVCLTYGRVCQVFSNQSLAELLVILVVILLLLLCGSFTDNKVSRITCNTRWLIYVW